jgi:CRP/FNR family transcriptional regulator, dissimilatory nitrate respiration regulator
MRRTSRRATRRVKNAMHPEHLVCDHVAELPASTPVDSGVTLLAQGAQPADVFFLVSGVVKLVHVESGGRELIVALRPPGSFLGSAAAIVGSRCTASTVTMTPCRVQRTDVQSFLKLLELHSRFSRKVHLSHGREIEANAARMGEIGCLRSVERLESVLRALIETYPLATATNHGVRLPLYHYEIASLMAVTPEHLSRLLHELQDRGRIRLEARSIVLLEHNKHQ